MATVVVPAMAASLPAFGSPSTAASPSGGCRAPPVAERLVTLVSGQQAFQFGWRGDAPARAFVEQLRETIRYACNLPIDASLTGVEMWSDDAPPARRVQPRDIFEGHVSRIRLQALAATEGPGGAPAAGSRSPPAAAPYQAAPAAPYLATPSAPARSVAQRGLPQQPIRGLGAAPPPGPKGRGGDSAFAKKGGSQLQFMHMMAANKGALIPEGAQLTYEEVARHSRPGDCWTIYKGIVYDVTLYLDFHPGGRDQMMLGAGRDCTADFDQSHPWVSAEGMLGKLRLGKLVPSAPDTMGAAGAVPQGFREFIVASRRSEADAIVTFTLEAADGDEAAFSFKAGQAVAVRLPGDESESQRYYTLTSRPGEHFLEVSVKRLGGGLISCGLVDGAREGSRLWLSVPVGEFTTARMASESSTAVLLSAGIGITPMVALMQALGRRVALAYHVDRSLSCHAFRARFADSGLPAKAHYTAAGGGRPPRDLAARLRRALAGEHEWYICGPSAFMTDAVSALEADGVDKRRIHVESFNTG